MHKKQHWEQVYTNRTPLDVSWFQQQPTLSTPANKEQVSIYFHLQKNNSQ